MKTPIILLRQSNAGYTLVELAIAVTVSGALMFGVITYGARVWAEQRASEFGQRMVSLVSAVESLFPGGVTYSALDLASAIRLGALRNENVTALTGLAATSEALHLYGRRITLGGLAGAGLGNQAWGLHYARLPGKSCLDILPYALQLGDAVALVPDPSANPAASSFSDWNAGVKKIDGSVIGFPGAYQVLKSRSSAAVDAVARINACSVATAGGGNFGLALVRTRI